MKKLFLGVEFVFLLCVLVFELFWLKGFIIFQFPIFIISILLFCINLVFCINFIIHFFSKSNSIDSLKNSIKNRIYAIKEEFVINKLYKKELKEFKFQERFKTKLNDRKKKERKRKALKEYRKEKKELKVLARQENKKSRQYYRLRNREMNNSEPISPAIPFWYSEAVKNQRSYVDEVENLRKQSTFVIERVDHRSKEELIANRELLIEKYRSLMLGSSKIEASLVKIQIEGINEDIKKIEQCEKLPQLIEQHDDLEEEIERLRSIGT